MESEGSIQPQSPSQEHPIPAEDPKNIPLEITLRGPVFDYWRTALDGQYDTQFQALQQDGNYQKLTEFKASQLAQLHNRFLAASEGEGEGAQKKRKIELSRAEREVILGTRSEMPFEAAEGRLLSEMRREFSSAFPSPGILEIAKKFLGRK